MAYADIYRRDRLFLPQQKLLAFARDVPTPFYLYDEDRPFHKQLERRKPKQLFSQMKP